MDILNGFGVLPPGAPFAVSALKEALSQVERRTAELVARGVFGVLSVENTLRLEQERRQPALLRTRRRRWLMSVVDKALQHTPVGAPPLTVPEAIASLLVAAISVDGTVTLEEAARIGELLGTSHVLRQAGNGSMDALANRAIALLTDHGLPAILTGCAKAIPSDLRTTTFALATDLALADGRIGDKEKAFIDELQTVLQIDETTAVTIVEVLLIKNRG